MTSAAQNLPPKWLASSVLSADVLSLRFVRPRSQTAKQFVEGALEAGRARADHELLDHYLELLEVGWHPELDDIENQFGLERLKKSTGSQDPLVLANAVAERLQGEGATLRPVVARAVLGPQKTAPDTSTADELAARARVAEKQLGNIIEQVPLMHIKSTRADAVRLEEAKLEAKRKVLRVQDLLKQQRGLTRNEAEERLDKLKRGVRRARRRKRRRWQRHVQQRQERERLEREAREAERKKAGTLSGVLEGKTRGLSSTNVGVPAMKQSKNRKMPGQEGTRSLSDMARRGADHDPSAEEEKAAHVRILQADGSQAQMRALAQLGGNRWEEGRESGGAMAGVSEAVETAKAKRKQAQEKALRRQREKKQAAAVAKQSAASTPRGDEPSVMDGLQEAPASAIITPDDRPPRPQTSLSAPREGLQQSQTDASRPDTAPATGTGSGLGKLKATLQKLDKTKLVQAARPNNAGSAVGTARGSGSVSHRSQSPRFDPGPDEDSASYSADSGFSSGEDEPDIPGDLAGGGSTSQPGTARAGRRFRRSSIDAGRTFEASIQSITDAQKAAKHSPFANIQGVSNVGKKTSDAALIGRTDDEIKYKHLEAGLSLDFPVFGQGVINLLWSGDMYQQRNLGNTKAWQAKLDMMHKKTSTEKKSMLQRQHEERAARSQGKVLAESTAAGSDVDEGRERSAADATQRMQDLNKAALETYRETGSLSKYQLRSLL